MRLTSKISTTVFLTGLFSSVLAAVLVSYLMNNALERSIGENNAASAQRAMDQIDQTIEARIADTKIIAGEQLFYDILQDPNLHSDAEIDFRVGQILQLGLFDNLTLLDISGNAAYALNQGAMELPFSEQVDFDQLLSDVLRGEVYYSDLVTSSVTQNPTVVIAAPVQDLSQGRVNVEGILATEISWPAIGEILRKEGTHVDLYNAQFDIIASSEPDVRLDFGSQIVERIQSRFFGSAVLKTSSNEEYLVSFGYQFGFLEYFGSGWALVSIEQASTAFSSVPITTYILVSFLIGVTFFTSLIILVLLLRSVVQPLRILNSTMHQVEEGDLSKRVDLHRDDELGEVAQTFNEMTATIQHNEVDLRQLQSLIDSSPTMAFVLQNKPGWPVTYAGGNLDILGYTKKEATSGAFSFAGLLDETGVKLMQQKMKEANDQNLLQFFIELPITSRRGEGLWINLSVWPQKDRYGTVVRYSLVASDVTDRHEAEKIIENERNQLSLILRSISDAVVVIDRDRNVLLANTTTEKMTGYHINEMAGKSYQQFVQFVLQDSLQPNTTFIDWVFDHGMISESKNDLILVRRDSTTVPVEESAAPLVDASGEIFGAVIVFRDVSKQREVDRMKSEFVSIASHQLKTPLNRVKWFLELLASGEIGKINSESQELVQDLIVSNGRMIRLINDLLNISRIDKGTAFVLNRESVLATKVLDQLMTTYKRDALKKGRKLVLTTRGIKDLSVDVDPSKMHEVIKNLLTNAIKYSQPGGTVNVFVQKKEGNLQVSVKDDGIGIPKAEQEHIFERFYRAANAVARKEEGTGLGLSVAKSFVKAHGGKIWFESKENKGTTFYVSIPISAPKNDADQEK